MPPQSPAVRPPRLIARQLVLGFGSVSLVSMVMCAVLLTIIYDVSGLVAEMREGEEAIRHGRELSASVRELSLHIAHSVIEGDESHLGHYGEWRDQAQRQLGALRSLAPAADRWRLAEVSRVTEQMDSLLHDTALPAAERSDTEALRVVHRKLEALGEQAAGHADSLALATSSEMAHAHVLATRATRFGLACGGACVILVLALSASFTLQLRRAVLRPLVSLTRAAQRFGRGEFTTRVGDVGEGELAALSHAMDHMADELATREGRLMHSERMAALGQIAAGVAHELNNPIAIIRGYLKTMTPDEDRQTLSEELAILDEEAGHCQRIAEDLLSYARTGELNLHKVGMQDLVQELLDRFSSTTEGEGRPVKVEVQAAVVELDPVRFRQLVFNLVNNASQASREGDYIQVRGAVVGSAYVLEVQDRGPGIRGEDLKRVFEPFFSLRQGGTGLGLAVCQGIAHAHRGRIDVSSNSQGTVVRVEVPLSQPRRAVASEGTTDA